MTDGLRISIKRHNGQWLGVVTSGGHPVHDPDRICIVLDVATADTKAELLEWWRQALVELPWETRQ